MSNNCVVIDPSTTLMEMEGSVTTIVENLKAYGICN